MLLNVKNLTVASKKGILLNKISFQLHFGEVVALVGQSGCGKSLLATSLLRMLPPSMQMTQGSIHFEDLDIPNLSEKEMRSIRGKKMGIIFQDPMTSLNPTMTVGNQIVECLCLHEKLSRKNAKEKACELLQKMRFCDVLKRFHQYPHELSGGMRQRIMIAIAIACNPKLLIADEPTTALDVTIQAEILELLKEIQQRDGTTILFITHDLGVVAEIADRVIVMDQGQIVETGSIHEIFATPKHSFTQQILQLKKDSYARMRPASN